MPQLLRISSKGSGINPMAGIVANILHLYNLETPNVYDLSRMFGSEEIVAGEPTIQLLRSGLSIRTIGLYDARQFLQTGPRHLRDISKESWTSEQEDMFFAEWTPEVTSYWQTRVREWQESYRAAGGRIEHEIREVRLQDIDDAVRKNSVVVVVLQPNPFVTGQHSSMGLTGLATIFTVQNGARVAFRRDRVAILCICGSGPLV